MTICPNCKDGVHFRQRRPKIFSCSNCGLRIEISEDWKRIMVTLEGRNWLYQRDGYFKDY